MNNFATEIPDFLDVSVFEKIAQDLITEHWLSLPDPQALGIYTDRQPVSVYAHKHLAEIKEKYPKFADHVKFMKSSKGSWPAHVDNHRLTAVNIPIANTLETVTRFYNGGTLTDSVKDWFGNELGTWYSNEYITYVKDMDHEFDHVLTVPTIINTTKPHDLVNSGIAPRIICSWAYNATYEEAVRDLCV